MGGIDLQKLLRIFSDTGNDRCGLHFQYVHTISRHIANTVGFLFDDIGEERDHTWPYVPHDLLLEFGPGLYLLVIAL